MFHTFYNYEVEIGFVEIKKVQQQLQLLMNQCKQMEQTYQEKMNREIDVSYERQHRLLSHSRRKLTRLEYQL